MARRRVYTSRRTLSHLERITPLDNLHHVASPTPEGEGSPSGGNSPPSRPCTRKTLLHRLADKEGFLDNTMGAHAKLMRNRKKIKSVER